MDTINNSGIVYTKASVLAKKYRYTNDYIGQLCRNNKVDANLVGRSWYVSEESLLRHKDSRYLNTRLVDKVFNNIPSVKVSEDVSVHPRIRKVTLRQLGNKNEDHIFSKSKLNTNVRYLSDETDLLPQPSKQRVEETTVTIKKIKPIIPILAVDAKNIVVKDTVNSEQKLIFTDLPTVALRGNLKIVDENLDDFEETNKPVSLVEDINLDINYEKEALQVNDSIKNNFITSKVQDTPEFEKPDSNFLPTQVKNNKVHRFGILTASILASLLLASFLVFAEVKYTITSNQSYSSLTLSVPEIFTASF